MSSQNEGVKTFVAAAAISAWTRVTINSSGQATVATSDNIDVGVTQNDAAALGAVAVRLWGKSFMVKAAGAITAGSQVYPASSGQVSGGQAGTQEGIAGEAATAAADVIEIFQARQ